RVGRLLRRAVRWLHRGTGGQRELTRRFGGLLCRRGCGYQDRAEPELGGTAERLELGGGRGARDGDLDVRAEARDLGLRDALTVHASPDDVDGLVELFGLDRAAALHDRLD